MAGDIRYSVEVEWLQKGSLEPGLAKTESAAQKAKKAFKEAKDVAHSFISGFGKAESAFKTFNSTFDSIASTAGSAVKSGIMAATGAVATGFAAAAKVAFDFNKELEETKISLAAIMTSNDENLSFGNSFRLAGDLITQMRKDAQELPGELKDITGIMQVIAGPLGDVGIGAWTAESLAGKIMTDAKISGIAVKVAAREASMMLEGAARGNMPLFQKLHLGMSATEFNKLDAKKRFHLMDSRLDKVVSPEAKEAFKGTWETIISTAKDSLRGAAGTVFGGVFERVKDKLRAAFMMDADPVERAKWKDKLLLLGEKVSDKLISGFEAAFKFGENAIKTWLPHIQNFIGTMERGFARVFAGLNRYTGGASKGLMKFLDDPKAFHKLEKTVGTLAGIRAAGAIGGLGASVAPGMMSLLSSASTLGVGAGTMIAAGGAAAAAIGVLAVAAYGAFRVLTDSTNQFHAVAMSITHTLASDTGKLGSKFDKLLSTINPLIDVLGVGLIGYVSLLVKAVDNGVTAFSTLVNAIGSVYSAMFGLADKIGEILGITKAPKLNDDGDRMEGLDRPFNTMPLHILNSDAIAEIERSPKVVNHTTNIGKVEIKVIQQGDPNRVAKSTLKALNDLRRFPISSSGNPNPTGRF